MKCTQCGHEMVENIGTYRYDESGLSNILLLNVPIYKCSSCKETEVEIPHIEELHLLIAFILLLKPTGMTGKEARYLRKHLGYTADEFASILGVTRVTVARWEGKKTAIRQDHDKHLRRLYLDKKKEELSRFPEAGRILAPLVERLPFNKRNLELRIRSEDWVPRSTVAV